MIEWPLTACLAPYVETESGTCALRQCTRVKEKATNIPQDENSNTPATTIEFFASTTNVVCATSDVKLEILARDGIIASGTNGILPTFGTVENAVALEKIQIVGAAAACCKNNFMKNFTIKLPAAFFNEQIVGKTMTFTFFRSNGAGNCASSNKNDANVVLTFNRTLKYDEVAGRGEFHLQIMLCQ
jgi:hypothetical protein